MSHDWEELWASKGRENATIHCKKCLTSLVIGHDCDMIHVQLKQAFGSEDCAEIVLKKVMES